MDVLLSGALGLATAVIAATIGIFLGAWNTRRLQRAKPAVLVDQIAFGNPADSRDQISPNIQLISALQNEQFIEGKFSRGARLPEIQYVAELQSALTQLDDLISYLLPSAKKAGEELRRELAADDYESLERVWSQYQRDIWRWLAETINLGHFRYTSDPPKERKVARVSRAVYSNLSSNQHSPNSGEPPVEETDPSSSPNFIEVDASSKLLSVRLGPDLTIYFDLSRLRGSDMKTEEGEALARRTAEALLYRYRPDLAEAVNFLWNAQETYEERLRVLRRRIEQELEKHRKLVIKGQINNSGGSPFSVTNAGRAFVEMKGYTYTHTDGNGKSHEITYSDDVFIDVLIADTQGTSDPTSDIYDSPISLAPGEVKRFIAVSKQRIAEIDQDGGMQRAFEGAQKPFYLGVLTVPSTGEEPRSEYSENQEFRNWEKQYDIPPK